jgi:copper chaperone CopZ
MATSGETKQVVLNVPGIHCGHCVKTINRELKRLDCIMSVDASFERKQVSVEFKGEELDKIKKTLDEIGYPAES